MAEQTCETNQTPAQSRYAGEWGLAALILAAVLVIAAILTLTLAPLYVQAWYYPGQNRHPIAALVVSAILTTLFWGLSVADIMFGCHAVRAAWKRCQPGGLPLSGTLLAIAALVLWTVVAVAMVFLFVDAFAPPPPPFA